MMRTGPYLFLCVGHSIDHIFMLLFMAVIGTTVAPFWGLTYGELALLFTPATVMFGLGSPLAGWLADRWSGPGMMTVYFIGIGISSVCTGFADGPIMLGAGLFLVGVFASIYHPVGIPLIVRGAGDRRGRLLGINGVFGSAGMAVTPVIMSGLLAVGGWRAVFIVPGLLSIMLGIAFHFCFREHLPIRRARQKAKTPGAGGAAFMQTWRARPQVERRDFLRAMAILGIITVATGLIFQALTNGVPKIVNHRVSTFGDDIFLLSATASGILVVSGLAQLIGGELADRFPLRRLFIAVYAGLPPALAAAAFAYDMPMVAVFTLATAIVVGNQPISDLLFARYMPEQWLSTAYGIRFALSLGSGVVALPLLGLGFDYTGDFALLFYALAAVAVVVVVAAMKLPTEARADAGASVRAAPGD
ncbi:MAG: MFS transporter [Alphaproteobacteria bacterium]|nr:MFS transporter [Alphaproteobacteria bacterium]MCY4231994.1 MFS transporter [Alphaproteobacteria bacterium]MCY4319128.1 MFS transporter [Alphaproteobacteria bacterium]